MSVPTTFEAAFERVKQLVADFRANKKFQHFYTNRYDGLDRSPLPAGAGEGGRRPGERCREQTSFPALVYELCALTPAEIQIVESASAGASA